MVGQESLGDREQLQLASLAALSRAEEVRKRLLALLSMGYPSIESESYLIKSRVKDLNRLVTKVHNRRKAGITYAPSNVTDIIGLRIITLYKDELRYLGGPEKVAHCKRGLFDSWVDPFRALLDYQAKCLNFPTNQLLRIQYYPAKQIRLNPRLRGKENSSYPEKQQACSLCFLQWC